MHNIYSSYGFILKNVAYGEAGRFYTIFTKDFGLIKAEAQGVRKLDSKLRYALSVFSLVELSFVLGRGNWRITNAVLIKNLSADLRGNAEALAIVARVSALLIRLLTGEEKNERLFKHLENAFIFLSDNNQNNLVLRNAEYLLVLRILHSLGYLGDSPDWRTFTSSPIFETELLMRMEESKRQAILAINQSLRESHL